MLVRIAIILAFFALSGCGGHRAQNFASKMRNIEHKSHSTIGISAVHIESGQVVEYKADKLFKMASTNKIPIAIYLLHKVQERKISLDTMVKIEPYDLVPSSGLMGYYSTRSGLAISIYNMLEPMITISDNSATDIILSKIGGPSAVQGFLKSHGINDMHIDRSLMQQFIDCKGITNLPPRSQWSLQKWKIIFDGMDKKHQAESYRKHFNDKLDTTTPKAMTDLLIKLYKGELLNKEYTSLMLEIMGRTSTAKNRIGGLLPTDAKLVHKTGSWNQEQLDAFYNYTHDVGIITMPNSGGHIIISVYTSSHHGSSQKVQANAIAKVAKLVYDHGKIIDY